LVGAKMRAVLQVHGPTTKVPRTPNNFLEALAAEWIDGLVDLGIATSSKHFQTASPQHGSNMFKQCHASQRHNVTTESTHTA
jgi:hypothetical protein